MATWVRSIVWTIILLKSMTFLPYFSYVALTLIVMQNGGGIF